MGLQDPGLRWNLRYLSKYVLKNQYPLLFLYIPTGAVVVGSVIVCIRALLRTPDVGVNKTRIPWENMDPTYRYQAWSPNIDFKKLQHDKERPDIEKMAK